jgi:RNA polymerase sigma factor (sigma-70 family)
MLRVYRGLGRFNGRYQLQAWVARIATNVALDMVRARSRRPQRDPAKPDISEDPGLIIALTEDTSEAVERVLDQEEIRSVLSSIPDHHREALVLREFEGRSHEEIGEALGVSPQQAKALIHRAKKSFRRAWDQNGERRGVAALAPIILLAPFRLPGFLRRLVQPAHDVVANATATVQQAAVQVSAAPAVAQGAVSMADKVTAAAITVIVAGTVGVGAITIRHVQKPSKATPVTASPAAVSPTPTLIVAPSVSPRTPAKPVHKPQHKAHHQTPGGQGQSEGVPAETPPESPAPAEPSPTPGPESPPPPPPPAPAWSGAFTTSTGIGATHLALVSNPRIIGRPESRTFGESMRGEVLGPDGEEIGSVSVDLTGWIDGSRGGLSTLWLWLDTPEGQYRYAADASVISGTQADDGSTTYVFSGGYSLSSFPDTLGAQVPHDGTISISLGFWGDGTLYATSVSMDES